MASKNYLIEQFICILNLKLLFLIVLKFKKLTNGNLFSLKKGYLFNHLNFINNHHSY